MSAAAFHVCYGLRWEVDAADADAVTAPERRQDPRQLAARAHKLDCRWGVAAEEGRYFLLVGRVVGSFGWEYKHAARLEGAELARVAEEAQGRLRDAGFEGSPAWHCQFEPDY